MSQKSKSFILLISQGILRDRAQRRAALFWIVVVALALLAAGVFLLMTWLMANPLLFLLYWGACLWLTITSLLLALYDLLAIRMEARRARNQLRGRIFREDNDEEKRP